MFLTASLAAEYVRLWNTMVIPPTKRAAAEHIADMILEHQSCYEDIHARTGVPWYFIGPAHSLEAGLSFRTHLHNGDPLTARTVHEPKGRPATGHAPFVWEDSAVDALQYEGLDKWSNWTLSGTLFKLEAYNGWGYRNYHSRVLSPYLWAGCSHYTKGKYTGDGDFDNDAVSDQIGAAVLLRVLFDRHAAAFPDVPLSTYAGANPAAVVPPPAPPALPPRVDPPPVWGPALTHFSPVLASACATVIY